MKLTYSVRFRSRKLNTACVAISHLVLNLNGFNETSFATSLDDENQWHSPYVRFISTTTEDEGDIRTECEVQGVSDNVSSARIGGRPPPQTMLSLSGRERPIRWSIMSRTISEKRQWRGPRVLGRPRRARILSGGPCRSCDT